MNSWRPYPLLRLLFPFTAGIIIELSCRICPAGAGIVLLIMALLLAAVRIFPHMVPAYGYRWIPGLMVNVFLFAAGCELTSHRHPSADPDWVGNRPEGLFLASVDEPPSTGGKTVKAILRLRYRFDGGRPGRCTGRALAYLGAGPEGKVLQYGDPVLVMAGFNPVTDNSNPHGFNYAAYLRNKGITHRVYAAAYAWTRPGIEPSGVVRRAAFQVRDRLLDILRTNKVEGREFAVASALLLGYVDEIDAGLRRDYAASGAMHILSVSGMHVGIIYIFLEFLLGFLDRRKAGRALKAVVLLACIWFYALVTGMSPCVLRSAAMLSLPILGKSLDRSPDMFNIIAASAMLILAIDPYLLTDVGFQLSYLAVLGIVILYKPIYDLYVTAAWLPDRIWSILSVSIAAQLATLPITLYTFHQFPNYFMLTNLFVVPLSSFIIYFGIFTLAVGAVPVVALLAARGLTGLVWMLNTIIRFIEELPCSTTRGIFISAGVMLLMYIIIATGFLFLVKRRTPFLWLAMAASVVLGISIARVKLDRLRTSRFVVFNAPHASLFEFASRDRAMVFYDTKPPRDWSSQSFIRDIAGSDLDAHGIRFRRFYWSGRERETGSDQFIPVASAGSCYLFCERRIVFLDRKLPKGFRGRLRADILVITGNPNLRIEELKRVFTPGQIIIDATNSRLRTEKWRAEASKLSIPFHAVAMNGAFEKEFQKMFADWKK